MFPIKNVINSMNILFTYKFFPLHYGLRREILKRILTYLYCTKYNEIKIYHLDVQKHVLYTGSYKKILIF